MVNLSPLSNITTTATALSNLLLVTPKPTGITAQLNNALPFLFNYNGEETVSLQSDITDHYIEDNTALQDQIALRPESITTNGYIGELNDILPDFLLALKAIADKLTVLSPYVPGISTTALIALNNAAQLYAVGNQVANSAVSAWNSITGNGGPVQNKQQITFGQFYGYWQNRTLFTVQTPWALFDNMAIASLRAVQGEETRVITDFEITFKKIRIATTSTSATVISGQGRFNNQSAPTIDGGTTTPPLGPRLVGSFTGLA